MLTWVYDEIGCPGVLVDEFSIRNLAGHTVGWVFGLSVFSLNGEHLGWCENGVFFDIDNKVLGFVPGAAPAGLALPPLAPEPRIPLLSKRPCVPALRGRSARGRGNGWSRHCLASYFSFADLAPARTAFMPCMAGHAAPPACEQPR